MIGPAAETAMCVYLGFTIEVGERNLTIFAPDGRRIHGPVRWTVSGARRFIRGYRKGA